jgi:hypothetical protein
MEKRGESGDWAASALHIAKDESNVICRGPRCSEVQIEIERKHDFSGRGKVRVGD